MMGATVGRGSTGRSLDQSSGLGRSLPGEPSGRSAAGPRGAAACRRSVGTPGGSGPPARSGSRARRRRQGDLDVGRDAGIEDAGRRRASATR